MKFNICEFTPVAFLETRIWGVFKSLNVIDSAWRFIDAMLSYWFVRTDSFK